MCIGYESSSLKLPVDWASVCLGFITLRPYKIGSHFDSIQTSVRQCVKQGLLNAAKYISTKLDYIVRWT